MNKSSRTPAGSNPNRRFSQPVVSGTTDRGRRGSEAANLPRGVEPPLPGKARGGKEATDGPAFDADHYNPDGSIRTVHKMPKFADAYAEASKARYIRHKSPTDREKELSVHQVFDQPRE
ncbi:coiled-coil domain-containing protein 190-like [Littorina saxatilis]|uniref:Uncharacterized protein n=1 Tax=Littorina saxatilis TaxID=31220 RepID=A0AAN9AXZ7_9CAEN